MLQRYYGDKRLDADRALFDVTLLGGERPGPAYLLTYPALESSRNVVFLVVGANKKGILERIRAGDNNVPAARVRPTGNLLWFVDRDAAAG